MQEPDATVANPEGTEPSPVGVLLVVTANADDDVLEGPVPERTLTASKALRTTGASTAALLLLALPLAAPAAALSVQDSEPVVEEAADLTESADDDLLGRVLEIVERVVEPAMEPAQDSTMEPAGGGYEPVTEPPPAPAAEGSPAPAPETAGPAHAGAAAPAPSRPDTSGPRLQGMASRSAPEYGPVQNPLVAGPVTVPAPRFADADALRSLAGAVHDDWAAVTGWPAAAGLDPYAPTQWPFAVAAGLLLMVGSAHVLRLFDERRKPSLAPAG